MFFIFGEQERNLVKAWCAAVSTFFTGFVLLEAWPARKVRNPILAPKSSASFRVYLHVVDDQGPILFQDPILQS
jgi:hypothetical protein